MDDVFGRQSVVAHVSGLGDEVADGADLAETRVEKGGTPPAGAAATAASFSQATEKYEVVGAIGQGGMGEITLVVDRDLRRDVAMKVQRAKYAADPALKRKFVAEAQIPTPLQLTNTATAGRLNRNHETTLTWPLGKVVCEGP